MKLQPTRLACAMAVALALSSGQAAAQSPAPSENATVNLIRLLVQQGVIKQDQADALLKQAEADAVRARGASAAAAGGVGASLAQPGDVRVPYIPETVREEIRQEVKADVMAQAKAENWAQPNTFPDWVSRITVEGDVRVRNESRFFDGGNSNEIIDFQEWNENGPIPTYLEGAPYGYEIPYMNSRKDRRNLWRIRARLGVKAQLSDQWLAGIRLATGSDDSPVSTTDTLGNSMGKKDIWLDQAYLSYRPTNWVSLTAGRAANPFESTDMLYSGDLNFDGVSAVFERPLQGRPVKLFGTVGAFSLDYENNPFEFQSGEEGDSENKWLLGAQIGADWQVNSENSLRGAIAYYHFKNITGQRSDPCYLTRETSCSTDWSRPSFMQKGNTLFLLRDIQFESADPDTHNVYQYVGLASKFNLLDVNLRWDTRVFNGLGLRLAGNYVRNLAYDKDEMIDRAGGLDYIASNATGNQDTGTTGVESGPNAWSVQATIGNGFGLRNKGDWMTFAGYKYIEADSMPDAYNDSSFHLGGTNARGYFIGGAYAFDKNVFGQLRWSSSKEIDGQPLSIDVLQLEVNARF